jgi:hypothetical protein
MPTQPTFAVFEQLTDGYTKEALFPTRDAAIAYANFQWNEMTERERRRYIHFTILKGYLDERGCFDRHDCETIRSYTDELTSFFC